MASQSTQPAAWQRAGGSVCTTGAPDCSAAAGLCTQAEGHDKRTLCSLVELRLSFAVAGCNKQLQWIEASSEVPGLCMVLERFTRLTHLELDALKLDVDTAAGFGAARSHGGHRCSTLRSHHRAAGNTMPVMCGYWRSAVEPSWRSPRP